MQSSRVEARCADEGHNEIESDAGIAAEQRSIGTQSDRHQSREMRGDKSRRERQADAEHDESRAMQSSRAQTNRERCRGMKNRQEQKGDAERCRE
jgi:hypothetical protein